MRKLLFLLIWASPVWAALGTAVLLDITDRSTVVRTGEVVLKGVPVPEAAAITDVRLLSITTAPAGACAGGVNIDSHRLVTERWHGDPTDATKSIKWILVGISSPTLAGSGVAHVCLADRSGADPGTATVATVNSSDTCADSTACTTVSTGVNKYWIRHDSFNLFDQVQRVSDSFNYVTHSTSGGIVAVTSAGTFSSAVVPTSTPGIPGYVITTEEPTGASTVNEDGRNLYAQVKVSGALWNGTTPKFTYTGRLYFFGGDGMWLWKGTNIYSEDMFATANMPTSVGLFIPTTFGAVLTATFGTAYGNPASTKAVSMANTDDVWLSQYDHGSTVSNVLGSPYKGTATTAIPWNLCDDLGAQNAATGTGTIGGITGQGDCAGQTESGYRIVKGTTTQTGGTGNQSDGWMGLDDGTNQANVWMRDHWQNYPVEIEANGDTIAVYQWPKHGNTVVTGGPASGDLTAITSYKRDMALAGQTGFGHFWPWVPGAAMNMTPQTPSGARPWTAVVSAPVGAPVIMSTDHVNNHLDDSPCKGVGCNFWQKCTLSGSACVFDSTKARKIYNTGFSGTWASLNGFFLAMWDGTLNAGSALYPNLQLFTTAGVPVDASGFGAAPTGCLGVLAVCKIHTLDAQSNSQTDSFGRAWEVAGNFTSHASASPGNDAARWRDTLLFTNPTYFCDTSLVMGHVHARDTANFARTEAEIDNFFNNLYKQDIVENVLGIYWGFQLYGAAPAGFGNRYIASIGRRHGYDIAQWLQYLRTGDPFFFHWAQAIIQATEVEMQHPPQVPVISGYAGVGIDQTPTAGTNIWWDTKHYTDVNNNLVVKHDGSTRCTGSYGSSVWFPVYNLSPSVLSGTGLGTGGNADASVNPCSDGQQPWLEYASTSLRLNIDLTGDSRSKELLTSMANNVIFSAAGSGTLRTLAPLDETSRIYNGGAYGRAFSAGIQVATDAAEILGTGTVNYMSLGDGIFKAGIQDKLNGINVWTQNPTGLIYDDNSVGPATSDPSPSTAAHKNYGSHYFVAAWGAWSLAEYVAYKGSATVPAPSYAGGHATGNPQIALEHFANGLMGYFSTTTKSGGLYSYQFPGRPVSDAYALTADAEMLKYIRRSLDFHSIGADDQNLSTGCTQTGLANGSIIGDTPTVPPATICASPSGGGATPPQNLSTAVNPNAIGYGSPDIHEGGLLAVGLPYLEYPAGVTSAALPDFPPSFVDVPAAGALNAPLRWITNCSSCGSGFTFDLFLRIGVSGDFGNLTVPTPWSGDFSLTVKNPSGASVNGITVQDSAGDTYTGSPTAVFKTPTQMWPPALGGGTNSCLSAPMPPSINYTDGVNNNKDNRDFLVTVPSGANGEYKIELTFAPCTDSSGAGVQIPRASLLSMSTGNADLVAIPCTNCLVVIASPKPTYSSGASACTNGTQVVTFSGGGSSGATGTVVVSGGVPSGAVTITNNGTPGYTSMPTSGTIATCTGTATFTGGAIGNIISQFEKMDNASILYANVPNGATNLSVDSTTRFAITSPALGQVGGVYRGNTSKNIPLATGAWGITQNGVWESQSTYMVGMGGAGGIKPLLSASPQTFYDSPNYSNQTYVSTGNGNPVILTFGCGITGNVHSPVTVNTVYSPTTTYGNQGCGAGTPSYGFTGSLPPGLTLSSSTGVLSGTPISTGTFNFSITESGTATTPPALGQTLVVNNAATCSANGGQNPLPSGTQNSAYTYTVLLSNCTNPLTVTISVGSLPNGLSIDNTAKISGTPTVANTFNFTVHIVDNIGTAVDLATSITISPAAVCTIANTSPLASGTQNVAPYGPIQLTGNGCGTSTGSGWVVTVGSLPNGLSLDPVTGIISGTATVAGTFNFTVQFNETSGQNPTKAFQIVIAAGCVISDSVLLPDGFKNIAYSHQVSSIGCTAPITWSIISGALPTGVNINSVSGLLSGSPSVVGAFFFTVQAVDSLSSTSTLATQINIAPSGGHAGNGHGNGARR